MIGSSMLKPERACLVIADISGYTSYLAGAELDHAQDILADLVTTVVDRLRPTLHLAKLEGDAAFAYAITDSIDGPMLQDTIEGAYFAFQRRLRDIRQASACECNACILVPNLDLKVVAHHGQVVRQQIGSSEELIGSDAIIVHRLLKNGVVEATGVTAYALYTDACLAAMSLNDPAAEGMVRHTESVQDIGEVRCWVADLRAAWTAELVRTRIVVEPEDALRAYEMVLDAPRAMAWEYITSPALRPLWQNAVDAVTQQGGTSERRGVGTVNHCMHGADTVIEEILDWQPLDHVTHRTVMPIPGAPAMVSSFVFGDAGDDRTRLEFRVARPDSAEGLATMTALGPMFDDIMRRNRETLLPLIAEAARAAKAALPDEPDLPASLGRNASEPITRAD